MARRVAGASCSWSLARSLSSVEHLARSVHHLEASCAGAAGTASQFQEPGGMTWPLSRRNTSSSEAPRRPTAGSKSLSRQQPPAGPRPAPGTKFLRICLGSDLIKRRDELHPLAGYLPTEGGVVELVQEQHAAPGRHAVRRDWAAAGRHRDGTRSSGELETPLRPGLREGGFIQGPASSAMTTLGSKSSSVGILAGGLPSTTCRSAVRRPRPDPTRAS